MKGNGMNAKKPRRSVFDNMRERHVVHAEIKGGTAQLASKPRFANSEQRKGDIRVLSGPGIITYLVALAITGSAAKSVSAQPQTDAMVYEKTKSTVAEWRKDFRSDLTVLKLSPTRHNAECEWYVGFRIEDARAALAKQRDDLVSRFGAKEQAALRAYVRDEFPLQLAETATACLAGPVALPDSLREAQKRGDAFVADLTARRSLAIASVDIKSFPSGAKFSLTPKYEEEWVDVTTDTSVKKVWRGKYRYRVIMDGYLPIEGERALMDGDRITIKCELVKRPAPLPASTDPSIQAPLPPTPKPCNFL